MTRMVATTVDFSHRSRFLFQWNGLAGVVASLVFCFVAAVAEEPRASVKTDLYGDPLPEHAIARCGTMRLRMLSGINALAFVEGSNTLVSAGNGEPICIWDCSTGKRIRESSERLAAPIAISPNGRFLLTTSYLTIAGVTPSYPLSVWDTQEMKVVATVAPLNHWVVSAAITNDAQRLVVMTNDLKFHLFDTRTAGESRVVDVELPLATRKSVKRIFHPPQQRVAISGDGNAIAFPTDQGLALFRVRSRELDAAAQVNRVTLSREQLDESPLELDGQTVALSADGTRLAFSVPNGIQIYNVRTRTSLATIPLQGHVDVNATQFSADGERIAITFQNAKKQSFLKVWSISDNRQIALSHELEDSSLQSLAFSHDGSSIATGDTRGLIGIWDAKLASPLLPLATHSFCVRDVVCLNSNSSIVTAGEDGSIRFWSTATGQQRNAIKDNLGAVQALTTSLDGKRIYASTTRRGVVSVDARNENGVKFHGFEPLVATAMHCLDDNRMLVLTERRSLSILDMSAQSRVPNPYGNITGNHPPSLVSIASDRDTALVRTSHDLILFSLTRGLTLFSKPLLRDGSLITHGIITEPAPTASFVVADNQNKLSWHRMGEAAPFAVRDDHAEQITAMAVSSRSGLLATGDRLGFINIWSLQNATHLRLLAKHGSYGVSRLTFSPDGEYLVSCGWDGLAYLWIVPRLPHLKTKDS